MKIFTIILVCISLFLTANVAFAVFNLHTSDPAGNGLAMVYTLAEMAILWGLLGLLLLIRGLRGAFSGLAALAGLGLFVLAVAAQIVDLDLLEDRHTGAAFTLGVQLMVIASPLLMILYGVKARCGIPAWGAGVALLIISVVPLTGELAKMQRDAKAKAESREMAWSALRAGARRRSNPSAGFLDAARSQ